MSRLVLPGLCAICCVLATFSGCSEETGPEVYPVTGTVLYNGQPVEGAVVAFRGESATKIATGTTDSQGRFELTTYKSGDGAVPGKHTATVSKTAAAAGGGTGASSSMEEAYEEAKTEASSESQSELPERYADAAQSQLEFTVSAAGKNDFEIKLTD